MNYIFFDKDTDFEGDITTDQLVLEGVVTGNVHASEEVLLKKGAIVQGEIATKKYRVEEGSVHQGKLLMEKRQNGNGSSHKDVLPRNGSEIAPSETEHSEKTENDKELEETLSGQRLW